MDGIMIALVGSQQTASGADPVSFMTGTVDQGYWPTNGDTAMWQDDAKTISAGVGDPVRRIVNAKSGGFDLYSTSDANRPSRIAGGLLSLDGSAQTMRTLMTNERGANMFFACVIDTSDTGFKMVSTNVSGNIHVGYALDSNTGAVDGFSGTPTYFVDGVEVVSPNRDTWHAAAALGTKVVIGIVGFDTLTRTEYNDPIFWGRSGGTDNILGNVADPMLIDNSNLTATDRDDLYQFLADRHGITLS